MSAAARHFLSEFTIGKVSVALTARRLQDNWEYAAAGHWEDAVKRGLPSALKIEASKGLLTKHQNLTSWK